MTIVSAYGTKIGTHINEDGDAYEYDGKYNPYPGVKKVTTKTIANKPLKDIKENNGIISLIYIEEPQGIEDLNIESETPVKVLHEGNVYIIRNNHLYDLNGRVVR